MKKKTSKPNLTEAKAKVNVEAEVIPPKCVLCDETAITTAVQIPVCRKHYKQYADEAKLYLPEHERTFYKKLLEAV